MLLDVLCHGGRVRRAADVVESLGVRNAKGLAKRSAASEDTSIEFGHKRQRRATPCRSRFQLA
jgi:hypothetical protein